MANLLMVGSTATIADVAIAVTTALMRLTFPIIPTPIQPGITDRSRTLRCSP